jgi:hypothetical protein
VKDRLPHIGFAILVSLSVLFAAYAPFQWSGICGYAAAMIFLVGWIYYAGRQHQKRRAN